MDNKISVPVYSFTGIKENHKISNIHRYKSKKIGILEEA